MTICIAGVTEGKKIVAITDKMLTITAPAATKYEISNNRKAIQLTPKSVALFAGDVIQAGEILSIAKRNLDTASPALTDINKIAEVMVAAYRERWKKVIEDHFFSRYGITLDVFMGNQKNLDPDLVKNANNIISQLDLGVQIIVAGVDTAPHVYSISNPGVMSTTDSIGYACVGSGSQHAMLSLIESSYHGGINEAIGLHALLEAKKRAEFDPGVGSQCDIVLINDEYRQVPEEKIKQVFEAYDASTQKIGTLEKECAEALQKLVYAN